MYSKVIFSGTLKLMLPPEYTSEVVASIPNQGPSYRPTAMTITEYNKDRPKGLHFILLPEEKWHVTLIHQSILKPYRKELKGMEFPVPPRLPTISGGKGDHASFYCIRESGKDDSLTAWSEQVKAGYRRSLVFYFPDSYQQQLKAYVRICMLMLGVEEGDPEPKRRFHISLANLTGKVKDSVR